MAAARRALSDPERFVLAEIQAIWGEQNRDADVFIYAGCEAVLFVTSPDGGGPGVAVLTNLGNWYRDGTLSLDELREHLRFGGA